MNNSNVTAVPPPSRACSSSLSTTSAVSLSVVFGVVMLFAVIGNSFVIWFARRTTKKKYNAFNYFLISMATADILDVMSATPIHWIFFFFGNKWIGGAVGVASCKIIYFLVDLAVYGSVFTLVAITMDRYFAICHVLHSTLSRQQVAMVLTGIWSLAILCAAVQLYKFKVDYIVGDYYCYSYWNRDPKQEVVYAKYEQVIKVATSYGIPLVVMVIMYLFIIRELWRRLDMFSQERNDSMMRRIRQQNKPLVKMFITLVTVFACCWLPVHVNHMLIAFDYQGYLCLPVELPLVFYLLAHANAAINPFLYIIFIENFRNALTKNARSVMRWGSTTDGDYNISRKSPRLTRLVPITGNGSPRSRYHGNGNEVTMNGIEVIAKRNELNTTNHVLTSDKNIVNGVDEDDLDKQLENWERFSSDDEIETTTRKERRKHRGKRKPRLGFLNEGYDEEITGTQHNTLPSRFRTKERKSNCGPQGAVGYVKRGKENVNSYDNQAFHRYSVSTDDIPRSRKRSTSLPTKFI